MNHPTSTEIQYAGFWKRLAAYAVDSIIFLTIGIGAGIVWGISIKVGNPEATTETLQTLIKSNEVTTNLIPVLMWTLYFVLMESSKWQGSIGKIVMGIRVKTSEGKRLNLVQALFRHLCSYVSLASLCIGFAMIGWTQRKQGLHDKIMSTIVVDSTPKNFMYINPEVTTVND